MNVMLEKDAFLPRRAHKTDAGLDLRSPVDAIVPAGGSAVIDTGVHVELPEGTAGLLVSKSGLYIRHGLSSTGLIDTGYTGSIIVKLHNHSGVDYYVSRGDKVSQLVIIPFKMIYEILTKLENAGTIDIVRDPALTAAGKKRTFWEEKAGQTVIVRRRI